MHVNRKELEQRLKEQGTNARLLAIKCGYSGDMGYHILNGKSNNREIQVAIAKALGEPVIALFGENQWQPQKRNNKNKRKKARRPRLKI